MITIAIDGPSGSGKSTISKIIAKKIGFINVDTGALYRTIAYFFLENKINYKEKSEVLKNLNNISVSLKNENFGAERTQYKYAGNTRAANLRHSHIQRPCADNKELL